ncbi:MAG: hypothetical protein IT243_10090 [Bacteroidia bacterium]|nr:hypothetical protein [Bacteroidia bacterium]
MDNVSNINSKKSNHRLVILILLIIYHLVLIYTLSHESAYISDSQEYINSSINYKENGNFYSGSSNSKTDYRLFSKRTPLYPLILYFFNKLNLILNLVFVLQIFIGLFNIYISIKLLNYLSQNYKLRYIFYILFILFTPAQFIYSMLIMADIWLQFFIMLSFWFFVEFYKTKHSFWLILILISVTLAALTKPVFLIFSILTAIVSMYYFLVKSRHKILILISLLPIISWYGVSMKNKINTGVFHYSSIGYINLLHYNTNLFLNNNIGKKETEKILLPLMKTPESKNDFKNNYNQVKNICIKEIIKRPISYAIFHFRGMIYFFADPGRFDIFTFLGLEKTNSQGFLHKGASNEKFKEIFVQNASIGVLLLAIFIINIIKTICFIGYVFISRKNIIIIVGAVLVFYIAFLTGPLGASRFALPVQLIIIVYAVNFLNSIIFRKSHN